MAAITNPELFLRAFLETARSLFPNPVPWLTQLRNHSVVGNSTAVGDVLVNLQDWGASGVASQGASTQWLRELTNAEIAQYTQAALDVIAAEATGNESGHTAVAGFNYRPSELG